MWVLKKLSLLILILHEKRGGNNMQISIDKKGGLEGV